MAMPTGEELRDLIPRSELIKLTQELVRIPSHSGVPNREARAAEFLGDYCRSQGLHTELRTVEGERKNVIVRLGPGSEPGGLMLCGHTDTVPPYAMTIPPFSGDLREGRIYGRGAVDMKGGIAACVGAMLALRELGRPLRRGLVGAFVVGEEERSEGAEELVRNGPKAAMAIIPEPTQLELHNAHRGLEWLIITIRGRTVHAMEAEKGINAIEKAGRLIVALQDDLLPKIAERRSPHMRAPTFNFGVIQGGDQPSTVAGECRLWIDRRWTPEERIEEVLGEIQEVLDRLHGEDPSFQAELSRDPRSMTSLVHVPNLVLPDHPLVQQLSEAFREVVGRPPTITSFGGWTDAALLTHYAGIPTVNLGPAGSGAHAPEEFVAVESLVQLAEIFARMALKACA